MPAPAPSVDPPLMLSISGARGLVGRSMTPVVAAEFAAAFGTHVRVESGVEAPVICVGRDSRPSGPMLAAATAAGLTATGCRVIDLGLVATPTVGVMIAHRDADGGMVVTASHNPLPWNGLKCLERDGIAPPAASAAGIITRFRERRFDYVGVEDLRPSESDDAAAALHVNRVLEHVDADAIRRAGFRVVLDSVNGAGGAAGQALLETLGCEVVAINAEPTGCFAHPPEPLPANLTQLVEATRREGAVCGFAQDPDGDRLALVDETGRPVGEESTLVLAARRVLESHGAGPIAVNLSTSRMIDDVVAGHDGASVIRTAVGEANVAAAMREAGAIIGGEGSGGVIFAPVGWVRDSLSAMALVLGLLASESRPLSTLVAEQAAYRMIKRKADLDEIGGLGAVPAVIGRVTAAFPEAEASTVDGLRLDFGDGWVHLRPSNTEPIVRLIAEATTEPRAEALAAEVASAAGLVI